MVNILSHIPTLLKMGYWLWAMLLQSNLYTGNNIQAKWWAYKPVDVAVVFETLIHNPFKWQPNYSSYNIWVVNIQKKNYG